MDRVWGTVTSLCEPSRCCVETIFCPSSSRTRGWSMPSETQIPPRRQSASSVPRKIGARHHSHTLPHSPKTLSSVRLRSSDGSLLRNIFRASIAPFYASKVANDVRVLHSGSTNSQIFPQLRHGARALTHCDGWNFGMRGRDIRIDENVSAMRMVRL
jgi:hypothetical protein